MVLFWVMKIAKRDFIKAAVGTSATALLGNSAPSNANSPADEGANNPNSTQDQRRDEVQQALKPQVLTDAEKAIVKEWQNSENGILRALFYQQDPFSQDFNKKNPDTNKPLTLSGVISAFSSSFQMPVESLIRIQHPLTGFDQANPYYVYLSSPVKWNSQEHNKQLFRIIPVSLESVQKNKKKISENNFTPEEGGALTTQQIQIALKILNSINRDFWDLRSPYSSAQLTTSDDGKLDSLNFNIGIVKQPEASQPRKIIFMNSRFDEAPAPSDTNIFDNGDGSKYAYLKQKEFENITK
jgi:hypothetical protein